ncbi:MFS multidrug transporter [Elsinoe ampelina]|uniref:MFS multidrug transporter n=1 Tax=Elsinoe ampelina TaxID=302913 RepID=A0A6A6GFV1_9PEZI|nr:MFS multidrug transporter [Elsinoe ampelina]
MSPDNTSASEQSPLLTDHPAVPATEPGTNGTIKAPDSQQNGSATYGTTGDPENATPAEPQAFEGNPGMRKRLPYILPAIAIGVFLSALDQTIIVSSYGHIGSDLHALNSTSWIATAYLLTITSFQPLYGKLSDIFGRKSCLLFAYLIFGLGCLFCGLARNISELIAARAFAGIGGGGMTTVVSILMSDTVSLRERGTWQGYINLVYATGAAAGAPIGGIMSDSIGWRWAFLSQSPLCLVAFIAVAVILKEPAKDAVHWKEKLRRIDFLGAAILIAAVFTLLLALDHGSNVAWKSTFTLVSLGVSIPLFAIFLLVEMKVASHPFAPGHLIFHPTLFACYACNFFSFAGWLAAIFYIPLYFQAVDGLTATQAGVRLMPSMAFGVSGSLFAGIWMQHYGRYYWLTVLCYTFLTVGMVVIILFSGLVSASTVGIIIGMCIAAFSNGIGVTSTLIGLIANAERDDQAIVTACSYLFRSLGCVFGVSMSATVANQVLRSELEGTLSGEEAREIACRVRESLSYIGTLEPKVRAVVAECYAKSTRGAFALQVGLVAGAAIAAWFIREKRLGG